MLSEPVAHENGKRRRLKAWKPKKWRPEYERMVAYSCVGWSNKMIAQALGYSKEHVSCILNMEEAESVRVALLERMREKTLTSIPEDLEYVARKTTQLLRKAVDDEEMFERSPFQLIDRGMEVLKGLGHLRGGGNGSNGGTTINVAGNAQMVVSTKQADSLAEALSKADQVKLLHAAPIEATITSLEKVAAK